MRNLTLIEGRFLGRGSSKIVKRGTLGGQKVAVLHGCPFEELTALGTFRHADHVVKLFLITPGNVAVTEVAEHGSLRDLHDTLEFEQRALSAEHGAYVVMQTLSGLLEMWRAGWVHGDVSTRNVLVFEYDADAPEATRVKLGDLGESRVGERRMRDLRGVLRIVDEMKEQRRWARSMEPQH